MPSFPQTEQILALPWLLPGGGFLLTCARYVDCLSFWTKTTHKKSVKKGCPVRRFRPDLARKGAGMITVMVPERALQRGARRRPSSWRLRAVHEHAKGVSQRASPVSGCGTHPCWRTRADDHHPRPPGRPRLCPVIVVPARPVRRYFAVGEGHSCKGMHQKRRKQSVTLSPR